MPDADDDAEAPMSASTLSRYETWPHRTHSIPPRVGVLPSFAQVYHCAPGRVSENGDLPREGGQASACAHPGWPPPLPRRTIHTIAKALKVSLHNEPTDM